MNNVVITERGWAGHFICAERCTFRRNTLIECGEKRIVVSTVGLMRDLQNCGFDTIGHLRFYETMAFEAKYEDPYWEADVSKQLSFNSEWEIDRVDRKSDKDANEMHDNVVREFVQELLK